MNDTTLRPPPERDFPPGRHQSMRTEIRQGIARPRQRATRWLVPLLAAAAVLLVVAVSAGLLVGARRDGQVDRGVVASRPAVAGLDRDQREALRKECIAAIRENEPKDKYFDLDEATAYNAITTKRGAVVLLYADGGAANCDFVRSEKGLYAEGIAVNDESQRWLPGAASIDFHTSFGTDHVLGGRIPGNVARVAVIVNATAVMTEAVNGTYLVSVTVDGPEKPSASVLIHTYDAQGNSLGIYRPRDNNDPKYCVVTPDGRQIGGTPRKDLTKCQQAVPWR